MKRWPETHRQLQGALIALVLITGITGCALPGGGSHQAVNYYDLGPPDSIATCQPYARLGRVSASQALQGTQLWYRSMDQPFVPRAYAISRWSAPPAELLRRFLEPKLPAAANLPQWDIHVLAMELQLGPVGVANEATAVMHFAVIERSDEETQQRDYFLQSIAQASPAGYAEAISSSLSEWFETLCDNLGQ